MFQRIVAPIDGSKRSWNAAVVASGIADACDAKLEFVTVVDDAAALPLAHDDLGHGVQVHGPWRVKPSVHSFDQHAPDDRSVGAALARYADEIDGSMIVMSSSGRGRTAAVLGSVADDVVRTSFGPIIVVGPNVEPRRPFTGDLVVPVDGSKFSELSLPLAAAWGIALGATPWIVEVVTEQVVATNDVMESSYPHRLARELAASSHHDVEFEVLHGSAVPTAICEFADFRDARLIVLSTHGRSGMERLTAGSVAAGVVHRANCPVVLHRPPTFALD